MDLTSRLRSRRARRRSLLVAVAVLGSCLGVVAPTLATVGPASSAVSGSPDPRSSITINRPRGTAAGQAMVASVVVAGETTALTAPDGWSLVRDDTIPGTLRQAVYLKVARSAEPPRYAWTLGDARRVTGGITAYSGVAAANPIDADAVALEPEPAAVIVPPALTTSVPDTRLVLLTAASSSGNLVAGPGLSKRWQMAALDDATTTDAVASIADAPHPDAGPAPAFTTTASRPGPSISALLALRPAGPLPPDTDPPDTAITAGPPATVTSSTASFTVSADEPASFTCALDGGGPVACSSPTTYTGLAAGPHTLTVVATDTAGNADPAPPTRAWTVQEAPSRDPVLVGAGDIADCTSKGDEATAALVEKIPGTVFTLGDNAYVNGTAQEFAKCYDPTWGRFKDRTMPAPGNHEYQQDFQANGYYQYFGAAAGDPSEGYYDYTLGSWHVIVLNSECERIGGCGAGSPQEQWLRQVLAGSQARCTVAVTHHARFSSAKAHGSTPVLQPLWQALYDYGADLVLSGHDHVYERFAPQRPGGAADSLFGLREIIVGTGGRDHRNFGVAVPNSEVRNDNTFGVLKLALHPDSYDWQFVPEAGKTFTDQGTSACHDAPRPITLPDPGPIAPGALRQAVYVKVAGADEPPSYTCALSTTALRKQGRSIVTRLTLRPARYEPAPPPTETPPPSTTTPTS